MHLNCDVEQSGLNADVRTKLVLMSTEKGT